MPTDSLKTAEQARTGPTIRELRDMNESARCEYVAARGALQTAEEKYRETMDALAQRLHENEERRG